MPLFIEGPESLIAPEEPLTTVSEVVDEYFDDAAVPRGEETMGGDDDNEEEVVNRLPFYRRATRWWLLCLLPLSTIAMGMTIAPRVEIYTKLVCQEYRPEYSSMLYDSDPQSGLAALGPFHFWSRTIPRPNKLCLKDPVVHAGVARLQMVMATTLGILSCITAGWWGQISDRYGRKLVLGTTVSGAVATDISFIIVSSFSDKVPGGYRFLALSPVIEGFLGGISTGAAATHAYLSDCTTSATRARTFSLSLGIIFAGVAVGPAIGSLVISSTSNLLSVFYIALGLHFTFGILVFLVIPESLSEKSKRTNRADHERRKREQAEAAASSDDSTCASKGKYFLRLFGFLRPLSILLPRTTTLPTGGQRRDWNLTLVALAGGLTSMIVSSYPYKFQYAEMVFGWGSEEMGYWISLAGITRATFMVLILPMLLRIFGPKTPPIQLPTSPDEPLQATATIPQSQHSAFNLLVARLSLAIEIAVYAFILVAVTPMQWVIATLASAFGSGFSPANQSLALELFAKQHGKGDKVPDSGRLFGALSVIQALCSQIIGPALFGSTYAATVETFPKTLFIIAGGMVSIALFMLLMVRLARTSDVEAGQSSEADSNT